MNVCNSFEIELLHDLKNLIRCDFLDWFMPKITLLGNYGIFWIVFAAVLLCFSPFLSPPLEKGVLSFGVLLL